MGIWAPWRPHPDWASQHQSGPNNGNSHWAGRWPPSARHVQKTSKWASCGWRWENLWFFLLIRPLLYNCTFSKHTILTYLRKFVFQISWPQNALAYRNYKYVNINEFEKEWKCRNISDHENSSSQDCLLFLFLHIGIKFILENVCQSEAFYSRPTVSLFPALRWVWIFCITASRLASKLTHKGCKLAEFFKPAEIIDGVLAWRPIWLIRWTLNLPSCFLISNF